jgi:hypothetical protein
MVGKGKEPSFGEGLLEGLREALAWKRGEVALEVVNIDPLPPPPAAICRRRSGPLQVRCGRAQHQPSRSGR